VTQLADTILMIRPAAFEYNAETAINNFFQQPPELEPEALHTAALREFDGMVDTLRSKGIEVIVIDDTPLPVKPDAVFPNNWFSTNSKGAMNVYPLYARNRREEKRDDILQRLYKEYQVTAFYDWTEYEAENMFLEGTGSMVMDHQNSIVYACLSPRTNAVLLEKFAFLNEYKAIAFSAVDETGQAVYHTNVLLSIGEGFAVLCTESIADEFERIAVVHLLESTGHRVITITPKQVKAFAGNLLHLKSKEGTRYIVLSQTAYHSLAPEQKETLSQYGLLLPIDVSTIERVNGGSTRCMMAEILLPPAPKGERLRT
jgi:hypothetical protein